MSTLFSENQRLFSEHFTFYVLQVLRVENMQTFQKGAGVVTVALFQATIHILYGVELVTLVDKKKEDRFVLTASVYPELYQTETITTETENPICGGRSAGH